MTFMRCSKGAMGHLMIKTEHTVVPVQPHINVFGKRAPHASERRTSRVLAPVENLT
jgi:hypothetical protein